MIATETFNNSRLVTELRYSGLDFLVPEILTSYDDDEGIGHTGIHSYDEWEAKSQEDDNYWFDDFEDDNEDDEDSFVTENDNNIGNIDELMLYFNCDYLETEDFLNKAPWELLGITKNQFRMIETSYLDMSNFHIFISQLRDKKQKDLSIEQRIKYATIAAATDCHKIHLLMRNQEVQDIVEKHVRHLSQIGTIHDAIDNLRLYADYLRCYDEARIMNARRTEDGEQTFNYTLTPKPSQIKDLHDKAARDYMTISAERASANKERLDRAILSSYENPDYQRFLYKENKFMITGPKNYADFEKEGKTLCHCIASYAERFSLFESYIYFLRETEHPDTPYYSIELIPPAMKSKSGYKLNQCYTYYDSITKTDECRDFINRWCDKFSIRKMCEI